jgi:ABC-type oligopeptide transport system substrate-binding subunit
MPPLDKKEVRLAIQHALNREELVKGLRILEGHRVDLNQLITFV